MSFCTWADILIFVSKDKDMPPYNKTFREGVWYAETAFRSTVYYFLERFTIYLSNNSAAISIVILMTLEILFSKYSPIVSCSNICPQNSC